mmetsp:Transcript_10781/g.15570  ORF Transcript_10781/g.15570 Transcript_10781/m.15570 type:complete len:131 (-) Transcript_10781:56-448(-)|eukprot:CAMPEP_0175105384 /NCGR_PEP_ID=MMETSP0086_2-20121207/10414_1 /TAXON_ID=136419 /ORGANISM="Unknown Unknown, Strain D1" /LENGTH=130 /DNA_ID=CAMNT_0016381203 /DNA_START=27 /DNA_END=422 /DNA_ORIENTATION=+
MPHTIVSTDKAPGAIGPYSQAVKAGNTLYVSGCIGLIPDEMKLVDGGVLAEAQQALTNMKAVVEAGGLTMGDVVKCTVLLQKMSDFPEVNKIYATFFPSNPPARACFAVAALPAGAQIEIDCIAVESAQE